MYGGLVMSVMDKGHLHRQGSLKGKSAVRFCKGCCLQSRVGSLDTPEKGKNMRIPSQQKVEAQAEAYREAHSVLNRWDSEYLQHEREFLKLREQWDKEQDKCPALLGTGKCNCEENPLYRTLYLAVIVPAHAKLMGEWEKIIDIEKSMYNHHLALLLSAKRAKERIKAQRQRKQQ